MFSSPCEIVRQHSLEGRLIHLGKALPAKSYLHQWMYSLRHAKSARVSSSSTRFPTYPCDLGRRNLYKPGRPQGETAPDQADAFDIPPG